MIDLRRPPVIPTPVTEVTGVGIRIPGKGERIAATSLRTGLAMTRGGVTSCSRGSGGRIPNSPPASRAAGCTPAGTWGGTPARWGCEMSRKGQHRINEDVALSLVPVMRNAILPGMRGIELPNRKSCATTRIFGCSPYTVYRRRDPPFPSAASSRQRGKRACSAGYSCHSWSAPTHRRRRTHRRAYTS